MESSLYRRKRLAAVAAAAAALLLIWCCCFCFSTLSITETRLENELDTSFFDIDRATNIDCGMRRLFLEKATRAVSWRSDWKDVFDALELNSRCNDTYSVSSTSIHTSTSTPFRSYPEDKQETFSFFVCPTYGKDDDDHQHGNRTHPYQTLHRALQETRKLGPGAHKTIVLKKGIHFLRETIILGTSLDSNLTIRSASLEPDKRAWLSGGVPIVSKTTQWKPHTEHIWVTNVSSILDDPPSKITGLFTVHPHQRMTLARYPNANVEDWNAADRYISSREEHEWLFPPYSTPPRFSAIDLSQPENPTKHIKNDSAMSEYNMFGTGQGGSCATVWGDYPSYWCSNISAGGWAFVDQAAARAGRVNLPSGITLSQNHSLAQRFRTYKNDPKGAIVHVAHTQGWAWHMFNVSLAILPNATTITTTVYFDKGGSQGGRNWQCKDENGHLSTCDGNKKRLHGGDWYIEGILDELDVPGEFFYDEDTQLLYFYPPDEPKLSSSYACCRDYREDQSSDVSFQIKSRRKLGSSRQQHCHCIPDLIATNLQTLIQVEGSMADPIQGLKIVGMGFRDAAKTYMEQWAAPSGGDWALHRAGAVHLHGTSDVTVTDCHFHRLDGNAIMLSGYNRQTAIRRSEFSWIGNGAMATWGDTEGENGYDATEGTQPRFAVIEQNIISNLGLYQKQSSGWGQNKACQNIIRDNVMFNLPRAAVNFNDGLGGGNLVQGNVIFNACRESGDHGPINSWDRMPFLTDTTGTPSFSPLPTHTVGNLILANYGASQGFDNDDGSSWYYTHDNVFYSADGFKMDYGGHSSKFTNNLVYGGNCYGTGSFLNKELADVFEYNVCILVDKNRPAKNVGNLFQCSINDGMNPANNNYFTNNGNGTWLCGDNELTLKEMQKAGFEPNSTIAITPNAETIISWSRDILDRYADS